MTAIIILFEMTDSYRIILPLMLAVVLAQLMASRVDPDSIYSIKLRRRGALARPTELGTLDLLVAADAMSEEVPSVAAALSLDALANRARQDRSRSWIVLDGQDRLCGMVSVTDLERAIVEGDLEDRTVANIMTKALITCRPEETLRSAFQRFAERDVYQIPVVDPQEPGRVLGVLRRTELMWAYKELSQEHHRLLHHRDALPTHARYDSVQVELQVPAGENDVRGRRVRDVRVPEHALIALLRRGDRVVVPRGFTTIESGDVLTLITTRQHEHELREWVAARAAG
jgi:CIC family chloride channel protein